MAQYAILIYDKIPTDDAEPRPEDRAAHDRHAKEIEKRNAMVAAFALEPSTTATSIRGDMVTDGPFIDAKEVIAGFCVIEAADLDSALEIARGNPALQHGGGVEVRPVESWGVARSAVE
ncbi:YciI family protein [Phytoactinopolyspora endophytica]|uniref:YciI family protein n=1 Tax=Phytoactinopolyspora endophytica TaxID=1642495 RepID=UPI00101C2A98|nr:YciI family protein [Phytoactinopolyspora endophytica]